MKTNFYAGVMEIYDKYNLKFEDEKELEEFEYKIFGIFDRFYNFNNADDKSNDTVFDVYSDSDIIYPNFLKYYPSKVTCIEDLQNMLFFEFSMLLKNIENNISDRVATRSYKPSKDDKNSSERLRAKARVSVWKNLVLSYDTLNDIVLKEMEFGKQKAGRKE